MAHSFKSYSQARWLFLKAAMWALIATAARAPDPFEIQVYEYETVPKGRWNLETHINYVGKRTKFFEGPVAPTNNQFDENSVTLELRPIIEKKFGRFQIDINPAIIDSTMAMRGRGNNLKCYGADHIV